jgi:hypothetical protein
LPPPSQRYVEVSPLVPVDAVKYTLESERSSVVHRTRALLFVILSTAMPVITGAAVSVVLAVPVPLGAVLKAASVVIEAPAGADDELSAASLVETT